MCNFNASSTADFACTNYAATGKAMCLLGSTAMANCWTPSMCQYRLAVPGRSSEASACGGNCKHRAGDGKTFRSNSQSGPCGGLFLLRRPRQLVSITYKFPPCKFPGAEMRTRADGGRVDILGRMLGTGHGASQRGRSPRGRLSRVGALAQRLPVSGVRVTQRTGRLDSRLVMRPGIPPALFQARGITC